MTVAARSKTTDKRFYGLYEGIVTLVTDDGANEGRVRIKLPWFDEEMETELCRVCHLYAGNGFGSFFIPEEGTEVLVSFIQGDLRYPVILGGLYNGKDKPPTNRTTDLDQKIILTKAGHEFLMDDSTGKERIRLTTKGGHVADLSDQDQKVSITTTQGQTLVMDDAATKITIETAASQAVELDGQGNTVTIKTPAGQSITLDGNSGAITLTGPATLNLEATSIGLGGSAATQPLVLGTLFTALFNAHVHTTAFPVTSPPVTPMTPAMLSTVSKTV
jgi:uncharacterized protein involved in type VI secretion and phage assembly